MPTAVVFAYHNVGVRCLLTLLARGVDVPLVVTHRDALGEAIWFESVARTASERAIEVVHAEDLVGAALEGLVARAAPDFIFSFYYRHMLPAAVLQLARRGAYNMHGSLLPKYRGRVPVNWAIIHGETETGATLHAMAAKPDAGAIVAQTAVPILPDDTALDVFTKVTVAAEQTLWRALPPLLDGTAVTTPNDLARGSYFGGRKPEDGRIDWHRTAVQVHDLVRAVAPPYPGATTTIDGMPTTIERTRRLAHAIAPTQSLLPASLLVANGRVIAVCGDGKGLEVVAASVDGTSYRGPALAARIGEGAHAMGAAR